MIDLQSLSMEEFLNQFNAYQKERERRLKNTGKALQAITQFLTSGGKILVEADKQKQYTVNGISSNEEGAVILYTSGDANFIPIEEF